MQQPLVSESMLSVKEDIFLKKLKEATAPVHQALEKLPLSASLMNAAVTPEDYKNYLLRMLPVVQDLEQNIYPLLLATVPDIEQRRKLPLLLEDLGYLDAVTPNVAVLPLSSQTQNRSLAFAMGIMYVMEGSTLGGKFIGNNIQKALGYTPAGGAKYFGGYGTATGSMWKSFLQHLDNYQESENAGEEIIQGAQFAFTSIYNHFQG